MRRVLVPAAVFAVLLFLGFLLLGGSSVGSSVVKAVVVATVFGLVRLWMVRHHSRPGTNVP